MNASSTHLLQGRGRVRAFGGQCNRHRVVAAAVNPRGSSASTTTTTTTTNPVDAVNTASFSRRELGLGSLAASAGLAAQLLPAGPARADAAGAQVFVDPQDGFSVAVPSGWQNSEGILEGNRSFTGASGGRRTLAWFPSDMPASDVNVTLTITNTSVEFTKLGSFGNVFTFAQNLVNSMDRSFLMRMRSPLGSQAAGTSEEPIQVAKLLDAKDTRGMYEVEYIVEKIPGPKRHLYSVVALAHNGRYNRLYTLTGQCLEEQVGQFEPVLRQVLSSFEPPAATA